MNNLPQELIEGVYKTINENAHYKKLKESYEYCHKKGDYLQAMLASKKIKEYEAKALEAELKSYKFKKAISERIVDSMSEEDRKELNVLGSSMVIVVNVLDALMINVQRVVEKYGNIKVTNFVKLQESLKETRALIPHFDSCLNNEKASYLLGTMSDNLYEMTYNKAKSYITKLKKHEEYTNKKNSASSEVA